MVVTQLSQKWEPVSLEAEQALLGAILMNNEAHGRVSTFLEPQHFSEPVHAHIYDIITTLLNAGKRASPLTVPSFMTPLIEGTKTKSSVYVARLAAEATTIINAVDYAKHIKEMADRRRISEIAQQMAPDAATEAAHLAAEAIEALDTIVAASSSSIPAAGMAEVMTETVDKIAEAYQNDGRLVGITTGLKDIDKKTGGLQRGNLVVLAGRPGMGKSAVVLGLMRNSAAKGYRCMFSSLEMSKVELGERLISDVIFDFPGDNMPYAFLRNGNFHERMFDKVRDASLKISELPIEVEEQPGLTMSQIATRARRMKRGKGLDILAIDHLDLVKPSGRYQGNKVYELGEITASAKALAKELDIVVVLLCQLSRLVESREDKRPILSDLRSSGSIEQDADMVIFLYRPSYYLQNNEPQHGTPEYELWTNLVAEAHNKLIAIIAKQRMGPTGPIELFCDIANNAVRDMGEGQ